MAVVVVNGTDSFDQWRSKTNTISTSFGDHCYNNYCTNVVGGLTN